MRVLPLRIIENIFSFLLIISCATIYAHSTGNLKTLINAGIFIVIILLSCVSFYLLSQQHQLTYKIVLLWIAYFLLFLIPFSILNNLNYPMGSFFVLQFSVLPGLVFYFYFCRTIGNPWSIMQKIDRLIYLIAIFSLLFWFLFSILKIVAPTGTVTTDWGPLRLIPSFYGVYFETQPVSIYGIATIRNTAFFTEGPMYAFVLSVGLTSRIFLLDKTIKSSLLLMVSMITTMTSTAIIVIILTLFFSYLKTSRSQSIIALKQLMLPFFSVILLSVFVFILEQKTQGGESFGVRMDDVHSAIKSWAQHPIIGNGIGNFQSLISNMNSVRIQFKTPIEIGFSSGLFQVFALGGIALTTIYVYPFFAFVVAQFKRNGINAIAFPTILLTVFTSSIVSYEWFFLVIVTMLYANSLKI